MMEEPTNVIDFEVAKTALEEEEEQKKAKFVVGSAIDLEQESIDSPTCRDYSNIKFTSTVNDKDYARKCTPVYAERGTITRIFDKLMGNDHIPIGHITPDGNVAPNWAGVPPKRFLKKLAKAAANQMKKAS